MHSIYKLTRSCDTPENVVHKRSVKHYHSTKAQQGHRKNSRDPWVTSEYPISCFSPWSSV